MNPIGKSIITEDGQRLKIENGQITGTEETGPGLAYDTGEIVEENNEQGDSCPPDKRNRNLRDKDEDR